MKRLGAALCALAFCAVALAQEVDRPMRASALLGMQVRAPSGAGRIDDLVVDIHNNRVQYAVLDLQGTMRTAAMPALRFTAEGVAVLPESDPRPVDPGAGMTLARASRLIGWEIENEPGLEMGAIEDLVVEPRTGRVAFAVVRLERPVAGRLHALPLDAFAVYPRRVNLVMTLDPRRLDPRRGFTRMELHAALAQRGRLAELAAYADALTPAVGRSATGAPAPGSERATLFERLDEDGDGALRETELRSPLLTQCNWIASDGDGDGRISRRELILIGPR